MTQPQQLSVRDHALERLCRGDSMGERAPYFANPRDRRMYQELVRGVTRHRLLLDWHLAKLSKRPLETLHNAVLNALRMGIYQIIFMNVPDHAAVSESVELVSRHGREQAKAFVNATLRNFLRQSPRPEPPDALLKASFPPIFSEIFGAALSWSGRSPEELPELLSAFNQPLPLALRVNTCRTTREALLEKFQSVTGLSAKPSEKTPEGILLEGSEDLTRLPGFAEGHFIVQSEASQMIAPLLVTRGDKPQKILDACAAPGGKTTHLAELQDDRGQIIALSPGRRSDPEAATSRLRDNIKRLGLKSIRVVEKTAEEFARREIPGSFDRILVDAPCTGLGTLAKHPERKWMFQEKYVQKLVEQQRSIVHAVWPLLASGGVLVYSVCSLVVPEWSVGLDLGAPALPAAMSPAAREAFVEKRGAWVFWPHRFGSEGLFAVRLQKP